MSNRTWTCAACRKSYLSRAFCIAALLIAAAQSGGSAHLARGQPLNTARSAVDLWALAKEKQQIHRFSTLFTAEEVRDHLAQERSLDAALRWCRETAVTKVYLESFRGEYAQRETLQRSRDRFRKEGIEVSGAVATISVGKRSTGWSVSSCYTDRATQDKVQEIFTYTASLFDEIMVDDFWLADCTCPACDAARRSRQVAIGDKTWPVKSDRWEDFRAEQMVRLSEERILKPARRVNARVKIIVKYPLWYDQFHQRGYDVMRESAIFDRTWAGTETRDYSRDHIAQYAAYFNMRWLGGIGGDKCGGGWFDPYGTSEKTYVEQARQTVLGGARETLLFCYGSLLKEEGGPQNVAALRQAIPELLATAEQVRRRQPVGVAAYKPPDSSGGTEQRVFDAVGMLGFPLVPCHEFPAAAPAAFLSVHALTDSRLVEKLTAFIESGRPVLVTDGLAKQLAGKIRLDAANVQVLTVKSEPSSLLNGSANELSRIRAPLLRPFHRQFEAPARVALYLFADGSWVIENFRDEPATVSLDGKPLTVAARDWLVHWE